MSTQAQPYKRFKSFPSQSKLTLEKIDEFILSYEESFILYIQEIENFHNASIKHIQNLFPLQKLYKTYQTILIAITDDHHRLTSHIIHIQNNLKLIHEENFDPKFMSFAQLVRYYKLLQPRKTFAKKIDIIQQIINGFNNTIISNYTIHYKSYTNRNAKFTNKYPPPQESLLYGSEIDPLSILQVSLKEEPIDENNRRLVEFINYVPPSN